jgi:colanic acid/amylovoran biosynthesis glycosyltransferase
MKKKLCFVLGGFPVISHPFLYNQIMEVIQRQQYEVQIVIFRFTGEKVHAIYESLSPKVVVFPMATGRKFAERCRLATEAFFSLLFKKPSAITKSLNFFKYEKNALNMNYLVFSKSFVDMDADIVHCHFGPNARMAADLKEIGVIKGALLSSFHGADITVFPKKFGSGYYKRLFQSKGLFTGNSGFIILKMIENGCPPELIEKIPECLNVNQFQYRGKAPKRTIFKILTVGRFVEKKGYEYSLRAAALLKERGVLFEYNIIGEGPLLEQMKMLAVQLGIADCMKFNGALKQDVVVTFYQSAHVFLLPSVTAADGDTEGQGLVLQEAQAIGLPVVATLHNGFPDSIVDGVTGYLVPEKDPQALFEKLLLLYNSEELCDEMGAKGRLFVEQNFDSGVVVSKLLDLYKKILVNYE